MFMSVFAIVKRLRKGLQFMNSFGLAWHANQTLKQVPDTNNMWSDKGSKKNNGGKKKRTHGGCSRLNLSVLQRSSPRSTSMAVMSSVHLPQKCPALSLKKNKIAAVILTPDNDSFNTNVWKVKHFGSNCSNSKEQHIFASVEDVNVRQHPFSCPKMQSFASLEPHMERTLTTWCCQLLLLQWTTATGRSSSHLVTFSNCTK